jgi:hypothetical protein
MGWRRKSRERVVMKEPREKTSGLKVETRIDGLKSDNGRER